MKLLETIKYENGAFANLHLHSIRMNNARKQLFGSFDTINLTSALSRIEIPEKNTHSKYKCRIVYEREIEKIELLPYSIASIKSLKIVFDNKIDYSYKYENRQQLDKLFALRENCDDILIIKNQLITDTYFCNIVFYNGKKWLTPERPLLRGTQLQYLIDNEIIETAIITIQDLKYFEKARLINAMISFKEAVEIPIKSIR